jgi:hypothetical protein
MITFKRAAAISGVLASLSAQPALAASFSITLTYAAVNTLSVSQTAIIEAAADYWESAITDYKPGVTLSGITVNVQTVTVDGKGKGLAAAATTATSVRGGTRYATAGVMLFDEADLVSLENKGKLDDVALHELAHAIGFGTLWDDNGLYDASTGVVNTATSGQYTGAAALAAYQSEYDPTATFVPVEKNGGAGTADAHWDETWMGGAAALLTGYLSLAASAAEPYVTQTTIASFEDLGYLVALEKATSTPVAPPAVPLPPAGALLLASFGAIGVLRRRSKR